MNSQQTLAAERFKEHVAGIAAKHDVSFILSPESHILYPTTGDLVNGYMIASRTKRELGVAIGKPLELWLRILAHESSHLDQYLESSKYWTDCCVEGTTLEATDIIFLWTDGKIELSPQQLDLYTRHARDVELDCERRTAKKIREFGLPIDVDQYIQAANSYIFFYTAIRETRSWYVPGKEPYNTEAVWSLCPKEYLPDAEYERVPDDLMKAYMRILGR